MALSNDINKVESQQNFTAGILIKVVFGSEFIEIYLPVGCSLFIV